MSTVTLVPDREVDPLLVRAYRAGQLRAWAVRDQFGWAIMARVADPDHGSWIRTVDRYEPLYPDEASTETRAAALIGLHRYAATGRTDVP
jgi:hypothetical protein